MDKAVVKREYYSAKRNTLESLLEEVDQLEPIIQSPVKNQISYVNAYMESERMALMNLFKRAAMEIQTENRLMDKGWGRRERNGERSMVAHTLT